MKFLELRGKALIAIILMTSGLDFLLFGCELTRSHRFDDCGRVC